MFGKAAWMPEYKGEPSDHNVLVDSKKERSPVSQKNKIQNVQKWDYTYRFPNERWGRLLDTMYQEKYSGLLF